MLSGRVAIVTGAGRGIGRATARLMGALGASVVVNDYGVTREGDRPDAGPAGAVVQEILEAGGNAVADTSNVATWDGAHCLAGRCSREFGRVDILVNNAGIYIPKLLQDVTEDDFDRTVAVHLKGAFACMKAVLPFMAAQGYGRVINITSRAGLKGTPGHSHYGAAKAAIMGLTLVAYRELAASGITVNAIQPAAVTRMSDPPPEVRALMEEWGFAVLNPAQGPKPEDVAAVIAYLASEAAGPISGQLIGVNGEEITLINPPVPAESATHAGGWSPESVAQVLPQIIRAAGREDGLERG
jgi:NAD(P)-dependent dehydrogenase (short-subunit alcohol dehydrogenase family)